MQAREGGTFRYAGPGDLDIADPAVNGATLSPLRAACGTLMGYPDRALPEGLRLAPELAVAHPRVSDGGKRYTFVIRRNARFSTGKPVLAQDAKDSLERVLTPALAASSEVASLFDGIAGARSMLSGKSSALSGVTAHGRTLVVRLVRSAPDFPARTSQLCITPAGLPRDAEGAKAPIPSAAPYYVARFLPGEQMVLERNTFYAGKRPHHVDRFVGTASSDGPEAARERVANGEIETAFLGPGTRLDELARRYGVNRSQFFVQPGLAVRMFFLNTSRPLFRDNVELRRAVNFAVDRPALVREFGPYVATRTDQFLPPGVPGYRNAHIYPLGGSDLRRARALAAGHLRGGKAVLYTCSFPDYCLAPAQVLQRNLGAIGLRVQIKSFPIALFLRKALNPREPYDIALISWGSAYNDPREFMQLFDGRTGGANYSRFDSPKYNRLLDRAGALSGEARYRAYGDLDVELARDVAPAIPYAILNSTAFVSPKVGCVVMNPDLDLTAVCLK